jgi:hypothetical protein
MKSEIATRNVVSGNDPAIRNPFGVMDVPNPDDDDVMQFARNTAPEESATDENAKPWGAGDAIYQRSTLKASGRAAGTVQRIPPYRATPPINGNRARAKRESSETACTCCSIGIPASAGD